MTEIDEIISQDCYKVDNYLVVLTEVKRCRLSNKDMRGSKSAYIVSCIDTTAKEGEQEAFCKRIRTKKDARKYYQLLFSYLKNYGKEGLMKVWDEVDKCFDYKVCINKDHTIHPWNVVQYAKSIYVNRLEQL